MLICKVGITVLFLVFHYVLWLAVSHSFYSSAVKNRKTKVANIFYCMTTQLICNV